MPGVPKPPGPVSPDPVPAPDLPNVRRSVKVTQTDGAEKLYPGLADYVEYYVAQGAVQDRADLVANYDHLVAEIFFNWLSTGQAGCLFAAKLAHKPRESRWLPLVQINALKEGGQIGDLLNVRLDAAAEDHEAAVVIFPDLSTAEDIVTLVNNLCSDPSGRWYVTDDGVDPDPQGQRLIGLRWIFRDDSSVNYVLGFAPIEGMSATRRSPFVALFLRIKPDKRTAADREDGRVQVHLADLDSTFYPQAFHDRVWEQTKQKRALLVEPEKTATARARVTFAVPADAGEMLCDRRHVVRVKENEEGDGH